MNSKSKARRAKTIFSLIALCLIAHSAAAQPEQWRAFPEPKFMAPKLSFPIEKAQRTVLVPGVVKADGEVQLWTKEEFDGSGASWEEFRKKAAANAQGTLDALVPEFVRNKRKVIEYAVLRSEEPIVASTLLAPRFAAKFEDTLGSKPLVVIPNRYAIFVFPALTRDYRDYAPMILREYRRTPYPVSLEVFEVTPETIRAVGTYEQ